MTRGQRAPMSVRLSRAVGAARRELRNPSPVTWVLADPRSGSLAFEQSVVVVTGAAGLIGSALTESFLAHGAVVHAVDRDAPGLQDLRQRIGSAQGRLTSHVADLADPESARRLARDIAEVDIVVNNVGFNDWLVGAEGPDAESWHRVLEVNLVGPALLTAAFAETLSTRSPRSSVLFVTSVNAVVPSRWIHYGAAKAALVKLVQDLATDLGRRGVRVNAVGPGWTTRSDDDPDLRTARNNPIGNTAVPVEAIVHAALFLCDPYRSPMTTGQHLVIDGGASLARSR